MTSVQDKMPTILQDVDQGKFALRGHQHQQQKKAGACAMSGLQCFGAWAGYCQNDYGTVNAPWQAKVKKEDEEAEAAEQPQA